jgi:hypothetical protein
LLLSERLDLDTGEASVFIGFRRDKLAEAVRNYHLPDFSNCQHLAAFARALNRLTPQNNAPLVGRNGSANLSP